MSAIMAKFERFDNYCAMSSEATKIIDLYERNAKNRDKRIEGAVFSRNVGSWTSHEKAELPPSSRVARS